MTPRPRRAPSLIGLRVQRARRPDPSPGRAGTFVAAVLGFVFGAVLVRAPDAETPPPDPPPIEAPAADSADDEVGPENARTAARLRTTASRTEPGVTGPRERVARGGSLVVSTQR